MEIVFTGLRQGEKLHETLFSSEEMGVVKRHPLINHVPVPPISPVDLMVSDEMSLQQERLVAR